MSWKPIDTAPEGELVQTKIEDEFGERNHQSLRKCGSLWYIVDKHGEDLMYVYYRPTHWRPLDEVPHA